MLWVLDPGHAHIRGHCSPHHPSCSPPPGGGSRSSSPPTPVEPENMWKFKPQKDPVNEHSIAQLNSLDVRYTHHISSYVVLFCHASCHFMTLCITMPCNITHSWGYPFAMEEIEESVWLQYVTI